MSMFQQLLVADAAGPAARKLYENSGKALAGLVPIAYFTEKDGGVQKALDFALAPIIVYHAHVSMNCVISDYVPKPVRMLSRYGVLGASAVCLLGLTKLTISGPAHGTATDNEGEKVYLHELTIYTTHELHIPFIHDTPEVFLLCDDSLPSVDLEQVKEVDVLYTFDAGQRPTAQLRSDGCVTCVLRDRDYFTADDLFGKWKMCFSDFRDVGSHLVDVHGEFKAVFVCPTCKYVEPPLMAPSVPPSGPPKVEGPEVEGPEVEGPAVKGPAVEGPEVEGSEVEGPAVEGSEVAIESHSTPYYSPEVQTSLDSVADYDYDEIVHEMLQINMDDLAEFYTDGQVH